MTWTSTAFATVALPKSLLCVAWSESLGLFVGVGESVCYTCANVAVWSAGSIPTGTYHSIAWNGSVFVAVGAGVAASSTNGSNWTARDAAAANTWQDVIWAAELSLFVAVSSDGSSRVMTSADGIAWAIQTAAADFSLSYEDGPTSYLIRDQSSVHFLWRDEAGSIHTSGDVTRPQWNLGYLESTALPPATHEDAYYKIYLQKAPVRLDITDGDKIHFTPYWSIDPTKTIDAMMQVSEHWQEAGKTPSWYQEIKSIILFNSTEGGALPSTIERVAAYTPLVSTGFDGNLTPAVNNFQALAQAVDDLPISAGPASGAANDFQVGDGVGGWLVRTLAQTVTILRGVLDGVYAAMAHTHAYLTDAASDGAYYGRRYGAWTNLKSYFDTLYAALAHSHSHTTLANIGTNTHAQLDAHAASNTAHAQMMHFHANYGTVAAGATAYFIPGLVGLVGYGGNPMIRAGTVMRLYFKTNSAQPASGTLTCTLLKNLAATGMVATIPAGYGAWLATDLVSSVAFNAGDVFTLSIKNNATAVSAQISYCAVDFAGG